MLKMSDIVTAKINEKHFQKMKRLCLEILCKGILRQHSASYVEILGLCTTMYVSILLYKYFVVSHFANCKFICATLTQ